MEQNIKSPNFVWETLIESL